jgi:CheY-like chemotaxis protein
LKNPLLNLTIVELKQNRLNPKKINLTYLIDDDFISRWHSENSMSRFPSFIQWKEFENGKLAVYQLKKKIKKGVALPDLILLDLLMPVMDGYIFLETIKNIPEFLEIPIIILTSTLGEIKIEDFKDYKNVKGLMQKPLDAEKIDQIIALVSV